MVCDEVLGNSSLVQKLSVTDNAQKVASTGFVAFGIHNFLVGLADVVKESNIVLEQRVAKFAGTLMVSVLEVMHQLLLLHVDMVALPAGHGPVSQFSTLVLASKVRGETSKIIAFLGTLRTKEKKLLYLFSSAAYIVSDMLGDVHVLIECLDTAGTYFCVQVVLGNVLNHQSPVFHNYVALQALEVVVDLWKVLRKSAQIHKSLAAFLNEVMAKRSDDDTAILGVHGGMNCFYHRALFIISAMHT